MHDFATLLLTDGEIRASLVTELRRQAWWKPGEARVSVEDGICWFRGLIESEAARNAACTIAGETPGIRAVLDDMVRARPR